MKICRLKRLFPPASSQHSDGPATMFQVHPSLLAAKTCLLGSLLLAGFLPVTVLRAEASTTHPRWEDVFERRRDEQGVGAQVLNAVALDEEFSKPDRRHNAEQYASDAKAEELKSTQEIVDVFITEPLNDTVYLVGSVALVFQARGFTPSVDTPIEVLLPQNGDTPALMESGNVLTMWMDTPCTQLVTLSATVDGRRASTSVLFSAILDEAAVLSLRAPLPIDARWGIHSLFDPRPESGENFTFASKGASREAHINEEKKCVEERSRHTYGFKQVAHKAGTQCWNTSNVETRPISLVFVGSLSLDGQKHVWLQQMESLPRQRFAPKYLMFQDTHEMGNESRVDEASREWKTNAAESFQRRLHRAGVPVTKVPSPRLEATWDEFDRWRHGHAKDITSGGGEKTLEGSTSRLQEDMFKTILESLDGARNQPHLMDPPWAREIFRHIAEAVKNARPDILVVANGRTLGDAVLTRAARAVMGNRGRVVMDFPNMHPAQGIVADVLAAPSHFVARHPDVERLAKSAGAQVVVIPPGVDSPSRVVDDGARDGAATEKRNYHPSCVLPDDDSNRCDPTCNVSPFLPPHNKVVGFVGRLAPEKGPGLFLAAAKGIADLIPSARFVVVGDGPLRPALEAMTERLGISSLVHFAGWVEGVNLQCFLSGMSLLFNPSLVPETFSVANIQAMEAGTPIVSFGVGGMLEYLSPGVNALILDDPDPRPVAASIAQLLLDPARLKVFAERGRSHVLRHFRKETALGRWAELYEALCEA